MIIRSLFCFFVSVSVSVLVVENDVAVIAPQPFHPALAPWIKYRTEQGYTVHIIVEPFRQETTTPQRVKQRIAEQHRKTPLSIVKMRAEQSFYAFETQNKLELLISVRGGNPLLQILTIFPNTAITVRIYC